MSKLEDDDAVRVRASEGPGTTATDDGGAEWGLSGTAAPQLSALELELELAVQLPLYPSFSSLASPAACQLRRPSRKQRKNRALFLVR